MHFLTVLKGRRLRSRCWQLTPLVTSIPSEGSAGRGWGNPFYASLLASGGCPTMLGVPWLVDASLQSLLLSSLGLLFYVLSPSLLF